MYVGIDYHKLSWKVTILSQHHEHKTMSQNPDPFLLAEYLKRNFPGANYEAVYEAGFSGLNACRTLNSLGVQCKVIHPADVPSNEKERLQKTDKADSRKLARCLRNGELVGINIPTESLEADRALIRQRRRFSKDVGRVKNRVKSLLLQFSINIPERFCNGSKHWSRPFLNWLKTIELQHPSLRVVIDNYIRSGEIQRKHLLEVHRQIKQLAKSQAYFNNFELLVSVPGIGLVAAMTILLEIGDIKRFKTLDEFCSHIGLVPTMHSSGDRHYVGEMINRGKKELKIMLIEASWIAIRHDPALMAKFNELAKGMPKNKAIVRIARKLAARIRCVLINGKPYELGVVK